MPLVAIEMGLSVFKFIKDKMFNPSIIFNKESKNAIVPGTVGVVAISMASTLLQFIIVQKNPLFIAVVILMYVIGTLAVAMVFYWLYKEVDGRTSIEHKKLQFELLKHKDSHAIKKHKAGMKYESFNNDNYPGAE